MNFVRIFRRLIIALLAFVTLCAVILAIAALVIVRGFEGTAGDVGNIRVEQNEGNACAIVFGAAVRRNARPGPGIARRVATAARLYHEGVLQHIIVSGGKGEGMDATEAEVMRESAIADGIPAHLITMEGEARSTWENLAFSRPLVGSCTSVLLISDRYHLARIAFLARVQGWETIETLPSDLEAPWYFELKSTGREVVALLYYFVLTTLLPVNSIPTHTVTAVPGIQVLGFMINKTVQLDLSIAYSR